MDDVTCAECGNVVPATATICPFDGNRIERPPRAEPSIADVPATPPVAGGSDPFAAPLGVDLVISSPLGTRTVPLRSGDRLEIGREVGPLADLCTDNVSGRHAEIRVDDVGVEVRDTGRDLLGSTNGTYLNGERLRPNVPVRLDGDAVVTCGMDPPLTISVSVAPR